MSVATVEHAATMDVLTAISCHPANEYMGGGIY